MNLNLRVQGRKQVLSVAESRTILVFSLNLIVMKDEGGEILRHMVLITNKGEGGVTRFELGSI